MAQLSEGFYERQELAVKQRAMRMAQEETKAPDREKQVRRELDLLSTVIDKHGEHLTELFGRLQPVMRIEPIDQEDVVQAEQLVQLAEAIRHLRYRVESQTDSLVTVLGLMEL